MPDNWFFEESWRAWNEEQADRNKLNRLPSQGPDIPEAEHFFTCECGEMVDRRRLGDVMYHAGHGQKESKDD